jgi:porphobilinogen synthase
MLDMPLPGPEKFIWPVFVVAGRGVREEISSMPGQYRFSADRLLPEIERVAKTGINSILIFGVIEDSVKDSRGTAAFGGRGVVQNAVRLIKKKFPSLIVFTDVCLCAYTKHGHCGPLDKHGSVDNDAANALLAKVALSHAEAGADVVAPSAMMDGQVAAIRGVLNTEGYKDTLIMSYSTKYASSMYGPFRDAERSAPQLGDRKGYQASAGNLRAALRESAFDEEEGADILMVKPALFYLDVLCRLRERTDLPIAAYNVSGEYAMLIAAAERGWGDLKAMVCESTMALARAGADIIISYWASRYGEFFRR